MKTVLVFGINGFIGSHYQAFFNRLKPVNEYTLIGSGRSAEPKNKTGVRYRTCDITNYAAVFSLFDEFKPEFVLNFAGTFESRNYQVLMEQNVNASRNILEAAHATDGIKKVLLLGSAAEYGVPLENPVTELHPENPVSLYGLSKLYQTELARFYHRAFRVPVVVARPFNITGEGVSEKLSVGNFQKKISEAKDGDVLAVGNLASYRDFLPVKKVVAHLHRIIKNGKTGEVYNICSGKPVQMEQVLRELIEQSGKKLSFSTDPALLKKNDVNMICGSCEKLNSLKKEPEQRDV